MTKQTDKTNQDNNTQETTETKQTNETKPELTVKQRIDLVINETQDKEELKKKIFLLVQKILYPHQFCPACEERLFFDPSNSTYNCPNCGYQATIETVQSVVAKPEVAVTPTHPSGKIPAVVEKMLNTAAENMKEPIVPRNPTTMGDKIRKLVAERDAGGVAAPTKLDEARIKNSDPNTASKINWV